MSEKKNKKEEKTMKLNDYDFDKLEMIVELLSELDATESSKELAMIIRKLKRDD